MVDDDLNSHVEEILDVLSENSEEEIDRKELEKEFKRFMDYGVPVDQAKQTLIKKFGGDIAAPIKTSSSAERTLVTDLKPGMGSVNLLGRVISINSRDRTIKGEERKIFFGIIGDESGTIPFTAWKDFELEKGDVVEVANAYTREWQGTIQLNFGDRVQINKTDGDKLAETSYEPKPVKLKDLRQGLGMIEVTARILSITEREVTTNGVTKKVFSGIIGDETGKAQFTSWHDFKIKDGDVLRISGGYIKTWKGIPQLTFDKNANVKTLDSKKIPKSDIKSERMPIFQLVEKKGGLDVEIEGTIIEIRPGSGLVERCPECNRVLINSECSIHGKVKGNSDIRIKLVVDDGTGAVSGILGRETTEKLLGKSLEECQKQGENKIEQEINDLLFAKKISVRGNALSDDFGTSIIVRKAELIQVDIKKQAEKLAQKLEELR